MKTITDLKKIAESHQHIRYYTESPELKEDVAYFTVFSPKTVLNLISALEKYEEALKEISIPSSLETSGNRDIEEYESLYEFWHEKAYSRLNLAKEALTQVQKIMEGK